jgi:hypothetical protein
MKNSFLNVCVFFLVLLIALPLRADKNAITVPPQFGKVSQRFSGHADEPSIIIIEDLHTSFQASANIVELLSHLVQYTGIKSVCVEGAVGRYNLSQLREIPFHNEKRSVVTQKMTNGIFMAAEAAQVLSAHPFDLVGAEDPALFWPVYADFVSIAKEHTRLAQEIESFFETIDAFTLSTFSKRLREFYERARLYEARRIPLSGFLPLLYDELDSLEIDYEDFLTLLQFRNILVLENQIHFPSLDAEIEALTEELMEPFSNESEYYKRYLAREISQEEMATFLYARALRRGVSLERYLNLPKAVEFWRQSGGIDPSAREADIRRASREVMARLALSEKEKALLALSDTLTRLKRLVLFQAERREIDSLLSESDAPGLLEQIETVRSHIPECAIHPSRNLSEAIVRITHLYEGLIAREESLLERALRSLGESGESCAILVIGKEHTAGLTQRLKTRGISYSVVTPHGNPETFDVLYMERLLGFKGEILWPKEYAPRSFFNASFSLTNPPYFKEQLERTRAASHVALLMDERKRIMKPFQVREKMKGYLSRFYADDPDRSRYLILTEALVSVSDYVTSGELLREKTGALPQALTGFILPTPHAQLALSEEDLARELERSTEIFRYLAYLGHGGDEYYATINHAFVRTDFAAISTLPKNAALLINDAVSEIERARIEGFAESIGIPLFVRSSLTQFDPSKVYLYVGIEPIESEDALLAGANVPVKVYLGMRPDRRARYIDYFDILFLSLALTTQNPLEDIASPEKYFLFDH